MITKEYLDLYEKNKKNFTYEINKLEKEIQLEYSNATTDSVTGSSRNYPYIERHIEINGINNQRIKKLKRRKKNFEHRLMKIDKELKYKLDNLKEREIADIIEEKYIKSKSFVQIMHKMNENSSKIYTADSIRMQLNRFFEKN